MHLHDGQHRGAVVRRGSVEDIGDRGLVFLFLFIFLVGVIVAVLLFLVAIVHDGILSPTALASSHPRRNLQVLRVPLQLSIRLGLLMLAVILVLLFGLRQ